MRRLALPSTVQFRRHPRRALAAIAAVGTAAGLTAFGLPAGPAAAASFGTPVVVSGDNASEPGIDVAPDGTTVYVNAPDGLLSNVPGSPSFVYRSDDDGASWTKLPASMKANLPGGGDSDIAIQPDTGALAETDLWLGSSTVSTSTDKGETWTANPLQGVPVQDRQWITATGGQTVYHVTHQIPSGLIVSRSIDGGLTYPLHTLAATPLDQTGCVCPPGTLTSEPGGLLADKVGVAYATSDGGVGFARSTNGALTFTNTRPGPASSADTTAAFPVVADGGAGKLAIVWLAVQGNSSTVLFNTSSDFGATWGTPRAIVSGGANVYPWVDYKNGKIAVSLYHSTTTGTPDTVPAGAAWYESYLESTDGGATFSALTTADPTAVKTGPICTQGVNCGANRELGDFQSVAIDGAGHALLTYVHSIDNVSDTEIRVVRES